MKGEETGIWLSEKIRKKQNTPFIYLTSCSDKQTNKQTISKALATSPNVYLIKPFNEAQIYSSISVALNNFACAPVENNSAISQQDNVAIQDNFFARDKDAFTKVKVSNVLYLEAENNYVTIYAVNRRFVIRNSLKDLLDQINSPNPISISRAYCVNVHKINKIGTTYVQVGDNQLALSRSMKDGVIKVSYWKVDRSPYCGFVLNLTRYKGQ
ncbi:MAG: two-component system response regulator LytT [Litorivivens sp.]